MILLPHSCWTDQDYGISNNASSEGETQIHAAFPCALGQIKHPCQLCLICYMMMRCIKNGLLLQAEACLVSVEGQGVSCAAHRILVVLQLDVLCQGALQGDPLSVEKQPPNGTAQPQASSCSNRISSTLTQLCLHGMGAPLVRPNHMEAHSVPGTQTSASRTGIAHQYT